MKMMRKVTVLAAWLDKNERRKFVRRIHKIVSPDVRCKFKDGGDYDSTWTFTGPSSKVKDVIVTYFQITPTPMTFKKLIACVELQAKTSTWPM